MGLPLGFISRPHQRELLEYYLLRKVTGKPLPSNNPVKDIHVYGDPKIWTKLFQSSGMQTLYFYAKLTKKKEKGKRVMRAAEFGTLRAQKDVKVYDYNDEDDEEMRDGFNQKEQRHIGSKRTFTFVAKKGFFPNARWTMHEYRLDGIYGNITNNVSCCCCCFFFLKKFILCFVFNWLSLLYCSISWFSFSFFFIATRKFLFLSFNTFCF